MSHPTRPSPTVDENKVHQPDVDTETKLVDKDATFVSFIRGAQLRFRLRKLRKLHSTTCIICLDLLSLRGDIFTFTAPNGISVGYCVECIITYIDNVKHDIINDPVTHNVLRFTDIDRLLHLLVGSRMLGNAHFGLSCRVTIKLATHLFETLKSSNPHTLVHPGDIDAKFKFEELKWDASYFSGWDAHLGLLRRNTARGLVTSHRIAYINKESLENVKSCYCHLCSFRLDIYQQLFFYTSRDHTLYGYHLQCVLNDVFESTDPFPCDKSTGEVFDYVYLCKIFFAIHKLQMLPTTSPTAYIFFKVLMEKTLNIMYASDQASVS